MPESIRTSFIVAEAAGVLSRSGIVSGRVDAEILAAFVLGVSRSRLVLAENFPVELLNRYRKLIDRRAARVPLQHLTGTAPFRHIELEMGAGVFVPRPETELIVDLGLAGPASRVVDLCAGSGAIALSVAHERPAADVYAVERDPAAVGWLRRNAVARAAAGDRPVTVVEGDATEPSVLADLDGTVDLVLSNPPYVPVGTAVPSEVDHDPDQALYAGTDGLALIRPLARRAAALLRPGGRFVFEHDETHEDDAPAVLTADPSWTAVTGHRDLAGRPRFTSAIRAPVG